MAAGSTYDFADYDARGLLSHLTDAQRQNFKLLLARMDEAPSEDDDAAIDAFLDDPASLS